MSPGSLSCSRTYMRPIVVISVISGDITPLCVRADLTGAAMIKIDVNNVTGSAFPSHRELWRHEQ